MTLTSRLTFLFSMVSVLSFAASWSGVLVNSECYASIERNSSPGHPASQNISKTIRTCSPNEKTKSFSLVHHGEALSLDSDGNEKARELVLKQGKKSPYKVNVTGEMTQDKLKVDTISIRE